MHMTMNKSSPPSPPLLVSQMSRQLLCPSGPRVLLGERCPFIKQEEMTTDSPLSLDLVKKEDGRRNTTSTPHSCSLCTGNKGLFHLAFFSSGPNRDHHLRSLLGEEEGEGGTNLTFCTACRAAVTRLFNLRDDVEDLEARIRTVVKLRKVGGPLESDEVQSDLFQDDEDAFGVQESNNFFVKDEPSSDSDDDDDDKGEVKQEPCPTSAAGLGSSLDFGHHKRPQDGRKGDLLRHECGPCGHVFVSQRELSKHTKKTHAKVKTKSKHSSIPKSKDAGGKTIYSCPKCRSTFVSKSNAITHLRRIHGIHISLQKSCPICSKVFMKEDLLESHSHPDPKDPSKVSNTCSLCQKSYPTVSGLLSHRRKMHKKDPFRGVCHYCGKVLHTPDCLKGHISTCPQGNREDQRSCHCGKVFRSGAERLEHERVDHQGMTSSRCYFCSKIFMSAWSLPAHLRTHTEERPFVCPQCGKKFSAGSSCRKHMLSVCGWKGEGSGETRIEGAEGPKVTARRRDPRYECSCCGQVFKQKLLLRAHMKQVHPEPTVDVNMDSKPDISCFKDGGFGCPECGNRFVHKKSVFIHMAGLHGVKVARRKFCPICSKAFRSLEVFNAHTHPDKGDPRKVVYNCAFCSKSVQTTGDLRSHKRRFHSGGTKCYFCSKSLPKFQSAVAGHLRTHTLERPYVCDKCGKEFGTSNGIQEHEITDCCSNKKKVEEIRKQRREKQRRLRAKLLHPCQDCERKFETRRELFKHTC